MFHIFAQTLACKQNCETVLWGGKKIKLALLFGFHDYHYGKHQCWKQLKRKRKEAAKDNIKKNPILCFSWDIHIPVVGYFFSSDAIWVVQVKINCNIVQC